MSDQGRPVRVGDMVRHRVSQGRKKDRARCRARGRISSLYTVYVRKPGHGQIRVKKATTCWYRTPEQLAICGAGCSSYEVQRLEVIETREEVEARHAHKAPRAVRA